MNAERLQTCLETIRWAPGTLARCLEIDRELVDSWATGDTEIPTNVASWLEALCFTHEASDLMRPSVRRRAGDASDPVRGEYIPTYSYGLLRKINEGPVSLKALFGTEDEGAVFFLVSRGLAERHDDLLRITPAGAALGQVALPPRADVA